MNTSQFQTDWSTLTEPQSLLDDTGDNTLAVQTPVYYRSKAFVSQVSTNSLTAAAAALFFLVEKIKTLDEAPDIEKLSEDISHELTAFEHQAQTHGYSSKLVLAARFALCLWIDETILNAPWGEDSEWQEQRLVDPTTQSHKSPFFALLNRCLHDTAAYIDLLELLYLCLSFGYEGEYRHSEKGHIQLIEIRNYLFERITQQRGNLSKQLEIVADTTDTTTRLSPKLRWRLTLLVIALTGVVAGYVGLHHKLNQQFQVANHTLTRIFNSNTAFTS